MGELLEISWPSHHENLCEGIWRLFDTNVGRDFQILFNEKTTSGDHRPLGAHFLIMQIFCQTLANSHLRQFQFEEEDINSEDLRSLLEFIYRGRTQVERKRLKEMKKAAEKLGLNSFVDIVQEKIKYKSLNLEVEKNSTNDKLNFVEKTKSENEMNDTGMVISSYGSISDMLEQQIGEPANSNEIDSGFKRDFKSSNDTEKCAEDLEQEKKKLKLNSSGEWMLRHKKKHLAASLESIKRLKCPKCKFKSTVRSELKNHLKVKHVMTEALASGVINNLYKSNEIAREKQNVHSETESKPESKSKGSRKPTSSGKGTLRSNLAIDDNDKGFKCTKCDFRCEVRAELKSHLKFKHLMSEPVAAGIINNILKNHETEAQDSKGDSERGTIAKDSSVSTNNISAKKCNSENAKRDLNIAENETECSIDGSRNESSECETGIIILNYGSISEFPEKKDERLWSKLDQILDENLDNIVINDSSSGSNMTVCDNSSEEHGDKRQYRTSDNAEKCTDNFESKKMKIKLNSTNRCSFSNTSQKNTSKNLNAVDPSDSGAEKEDNLNPAHISPVLNCGECGRRFKNKVMFDRHVLNHSDPNGLTDQCPYCPFKSKYLRSHLASKHQRDLKGNFLKKSYKCDECHFRCAASFLLLNHKTWTHGEKNHKCEQCPYASRTKGNLDKHVAAVHPSGSGLSEKKVRRKKSRLMKHLNCETSEKRRSEDLNIADENTENQIDKSRESTSDNGGTSGDLEEHSVEKEDKLKPERIRSYSVSKFTCAECGKRIKDKVKFDHHVLTHSDPTELPQCPYCPFKTKYLRVHLASKHQRDLAGNYLEKSLKCDQCDFVCAAQFLLYNHKAGTHCEKIHKCDQCPYTSRTRRSLDNHVLTAHTDEKNFMCETCGSFFNSKIKLYKHKMTHSSPQFTCEICGKIKIGKGNMKRHLNQHKTFECPICKYGFKMRYRLKYHLQKTHKFLEDEVTRLLDIAENNDNGDNVKQIDTQNVETL